MELNDFVKKFTEQFEESEFGNIESDVDYKSLSTWDSLTAMSVQVMIHDEYGVGVTSEDFKKTTTVKDLFELIKSKI